MNRIERYEVDAATTHFGATRVGDIFRTTSSYAKLPAGGPGYVLRSTIRTLIPVVSNAAGNAAFQFVPAFVWAPLFGSVPTFTAGNGQLTLSGAGDISARDIDGYFMPGSSTTLSCQSMRVVGAAARFVPTTNGTNNGGTVESLPFRIGTNATVVPGFPDVADQYNSYKSLDGVKDPLHWVCAPVDTRWIDYCEVNTNSRAYNSQQSIDIAQRWTALALFFKGLPASITVGFMEFAIHLDTLPVTGTLENKFVTREIPLNRHFVDHHHAILATMTRAPYHGPVDTIADFLERAHKEGLVNAAKHDVDEMTRSMGRLGKELARGLPPAIKRGTTSSLAGNSATPSGHDGRASMARLKTARPKRTIQSQKTKRKPRR